MEDYSKEWFIMLRDENRSIGCIAQLVGCTAASLSGWLLGENPKPTFTAKPMPTTEEVRNLCPSLVYDPDRRAGGKANTDEVAPQDAAK